MTFLTFFGIDDAPILIVMLDAAQFDVKLLDYRVISQELTLFLAKYDFLFNFKGTDFLRRRVWEKVPEGVG